MSEIFEIVEIKNDFMRILECWFLLKFIFAESSSQENCGVELISSIL
jgi:hypothetical protein